MLADEEPRLAAAPRAPHGVVPRLRSRGKVYDLHVFPDRIALAEVRGPDPATLGFVGGLIGMAIGQQLARRATATRVGRTAWSSVEELAAEGAEVLSPAWISSLEVRHHGAGGRLRLELAGSGGGSRTFSWSKGDVKGLDVDGLFHAALPGRAVVHGVSDARRIGRAVAVVGVLLLVVVTGIVVATRGPTGGDAPAAIRPAAVAPLGRACATWATLRSPDFAPSQLPGVVRQTRLELELAADADRSLWPAAEAAAVLDRIYSSLAAVSQLDIDAQAAVVDEACARG